MDEAPARHQQRMAAWNLAGSLGAVCGPLMLAALLTAGGRWRAAYLLLAGAGGRRCDGGDGRARTPLAGAATARRPVAEDSNARDSEPPGADEDLRPSDEDLRRRSGSQAGPRRGPAASAEDDGTCGFSCTGAVEERRLTVREALAALRHGTTVRLAHPARDQRPAARRAHRLRRHLPGRRRPRQPGRGGASGSRSGWAPALAGDALFVPLSRRVCGPAACCARPRCAAAVLYPAFLLVPWLRAKLAVLAGC